MDYPAIIEGMPSEEYHACTELSKHDLDKVAISPLHFKTYKAEPQEATEAMQIGTLVHTAILEPDLFSDSFLLAPDCDKRSKEGKDRWKTAQEEAELSGKIVAPEQTIKNIRLMAESVFAHRSAKLALSSGGMVEASIFARDPETGVAIRSRPDLITKGNSIVDVKTCQVEKGGIAEFAKSVANFRYDVQAAFYLDICKLAGLEKTAFVFIVIEKEAPFAVATYQLDEDSIAAGRAQYRKNLAFYAECLKNDEWPCYSQGVEVISLPKWKLRQLENAA